MKNYNNRRRFLLTSLAVGSGLALGKRSFSADKPKDKMKEIFEVIKHRRSVRKFKDIPVPQDHIEMILEAATWAPNPRNRQAWKFLVVNDRNIIDEMKKVSIKMFGEQNREMADMYFSAPVYIVILAETNTPNPPNDLIGAALAGQNLMLAARSLGYGTCFITNAIPDDVTKQVLNIPELYKRICITPIGIPEDWPTSEGRKPLSEVVVYNKI